MSNTDTNTVEKYSLRITGDSKSVAEARRKVNTHDDLLAACQSLASVVEQLIPEPSARGVADVVLAQARAAIRRATEPTP